MTNDYFIQTRLSSIFDQTGDSTSTLKLTLRNLSSKNFPTSLTVNVHGDKIDLVSAKDDYGDVNFISNFRPVGINAITANFNRRLVGKDMVSHLTLVYKNPKALRQDNTWVIIYPKISLNSPGDFSYQLSVPNSFGRLVAAETLPNAKSVSTDTTLYTISGKQLESSSRLIFGDSYPYEFHLQFENTSEIILPKDTESQKIYIAKINPSPNQVVLQNSDWIAKYNDPQAKVSVSGYAVYFNSNEKMTNDNMVKFEAHPYQYLPAKNIHISLTPPKYFFPFVSNQLDFHITNPNFQALYNVNLSLNPTGLSVFPPSPLITAIPPSGTVSLPISVKLGLDTLFTTKSLQISTQDLNFSYNPPKDALIFYYLFYSVLISFIFIFALILTRHAWRVFFLRRRR